MIPRVPDLRVLRFTSGETARAVELPARSDLSAALDAERASGPRVLVLANDDLTRLPWSPGRLIDRGRKHAAKALAPILLGQDRIPVLRGSYRSAGQLGRSVRALLNRAVRQGERNLYLLGVDAQLFARLWREAAPARPADGAQAAAAASDSGPTGTLLDLLPRLPIPDTVRRRFVGESAEVDLVRQLVLRAAQQDDPVLILGDTGTGKEVVARLIHDQSARRLQTFTPVNCGAIPRELFESELFGYEKGAHSTASGRKQGLWRVAHGGTLFLDEIADLSLEHQVKVLRALEHGEIRPVGAEREQRVDARIIAATNRDIFAMVQAGSIREDLYYRLRAFMIRTPALRDHAEDIPLLARHFWSSITQDPRSDLAPDIVRELSAYRWPGNARELRMVLSSLYGLFGADGLGVKHLRAVFAFEGQAQATPGAGAASAEFQVHRVECLRHLRRVLDVVRACAVTLGPVLRAADVQRRVVQSALGGLRRHARELEVLCLRPALFHSEAVFTRVRGLAETLATLVRTAAEDPAAVASLRRPALEHDLDLAGSTVFREIERLQSARA